MPHSFDVVIDAHARLKDAIVAQFIVGTLLAATVAVLVQTLPQLLNSVP
jgi:hypothetical protein